MKFKSILSGVGICALALALLAAFATLPAYLLFLFWNALAPVFHAPHLTFGQAWIAWALLSLVGGAFKGSTITSKK